MRREMLARRGDPHTSHEAAAKVDTFKAGHEALIVSAWNGHCGGLTYREIASVTRLEPVAVARRLVSMERRKVIYRIETAPGKYAARDGMAVWFRK